jgi:ubiquinone/menaquinone biosynthesis C-methylase UbiE
MSEQPADADFDILYRQLHLPERLAERPFLAIGTEAFEHPYWRVVEAPFGSDGTLLPIDIADGTLEAVYIGHGLARTFNEGTKSAIVEAYRMLQPGGTLRIAVPDAQLAFYASLRGDNFFFGTTEQETPAIYLLADSLSLILSPEYAGRMTREELVRLSWTQAFEKMMAVLYIASQEVVATTGDTHGRAVNWYSFEKLSRMFRDVGFSEIRRSAFAQSLRPILRDTRYFDSTRPGASLYIEAIKLKYY